MSLNSFVSGGSYSRRAVVGAGLALGAGSRLATAQAGAGMAGSVPAAAAQATPEATPGGDTTAPAVISSIARDYLANSALRAVIVRVTVGGAEVATVAFGESMTGVPATADMHFRNGAVAIAYLATLMLRFVDEGRLGLDDPIDAWAPDLPDAGEVTPRMLANMTAGYPDYVPNPDFVSQVYTYPFRSWTGDELIEYGLATPRSFAPGTNWDYSHTNMVILGRVLEAVGGQPLADLLEQYVLAPLGLTNTTSSQSAAIPEPVLHAFSSERRGALGIPDGQPFYEESTFWNPSWTLAPGSIQTTTITDLTTTARAVGEGILLSPESHRAQISPSLVGFGEPLAGCNTCHTLTDAYSYGLGLVISGEWLLQNPLFGGYGAITAYLPSRQIAIAAATTFAEDAFDDSGGFVYPRASWRIFADIAAYLAPEAAPVATRE